VVGAGLGGLSAACHLTAQPGTEVTVLERALVPGGRAGLVELGGYRMDPGPVVLTMPDLLEDAFRAAGTTTANHVRIRPLDPMYRGVFDEGSQLRIRHGRDAMTEEIRTFAGAKEADGFRRFAQRLTELYEVETPNFIDRNFDSVLDLARPLSPGLKLLRLGGFRKLHNLVADYITDPRLQKMFSFQAMYAGLSPYEALGVYAVITYMDSIAGVYCADGGMHAVSRGLAEAATKAGVQIRYGETVERVLQANGSNGAVRGVRLASGEVIPADSVVVNADVPVAYTSLLPHLEPPRVLRKGHYSPSCALWLAGVKGALPTGAEHHNIHFGSQWKASFDALLKTGERQPDPSILVTIPTVSDPTLAPAGGRHVLYVLEPTPNLAGKINWDVERERVQADLAERVGKLGYPVEVEVETFLDPTDWERQGMALGTPFALSHRFFQTGPFRAKNIENRVPGLVFVGSSTVPGVGVPMVLISGKLAAARVSEYFTSAS
jgi:phytoene desaturase